MKNWKTAPGDQHVHLILDAKPYKPIYDPKAPVKLCDLTGGEPLAEGQHVLVAFPSRANHESVKTAGALSITEFWVGKKGAKTDVAQDVDQADAHLQPPQGRIQRRHGEPRPRRLPAR